MADYFQILGSDTCLLALKNMTAQQLNGLIVAQTDKSYEFSFHGKHEQGCPLYVTKLKKRGTGMAKILTEGKSKPSWTHTGYSLTKKQLKSAIACATANWAFLCKLAQDYYKPTEEETVLPKGQCKNCKEEFDDISGFTPVQHYDGYYVCPKCGNKGFVKPI